MLHTKIETRSAVPIETRDDDPLAAATAAVDELRSAAEQARTEQTNELRGITERIASIETRLNRPGAEQPANDGVSAERRAFAAYLRHGNQAPADELRTLIASSDPQGGYLTPAETSTEFIRELVQYSPLRGLATVRQTTAPAVQYPTRTGRTNAKWKGETQAQTSDAEPSFGQTEINVREVNTFIDISNQLLADSAGVAEAEVRMALAEDFGLKEGTAFAHGSGPLQPEGILVNPDVGYLPTGHASTLGTNPADLLINLMYALPTPYRGRGTWLMNSTSLATVRKLKDGQGNYLWQPSYQVGQPELILGRPVIEAPDFADIGAGNEPIMFGDIATAYRIIDRLALSVLVNPFIRATDGITRIHATRRVGGAVIVPSAIKKIRVGTA